MFIFGAEFNKETVDWILNKTKLAIIENCREDTRRLRGYCCEVKCNGNLICFYQTQAYSCTEYNCIDLVISIRQCTSMSTQTDYIYPTPLTSSLSLILIIGQVGGRFFQSFWIIYVTWYLRQSFRVIYEASGPIYWFLCQVSPSFRSPPAWSCSSVTGPAQSSATI